MKIKHLLIISFIVSILTTSYLFYLQSIMYSIGGDTAKCLDLRYYYNYYDVMELFSNLGEKGMALYRWMIAVDMIYPIFYGLFGSFLLLFLSQNWQKNRIWLLLFPILIVIFDYIENTHSLGLINAFEEVIIDADMVSKAYTFTLLKHIAVLVFISLAIGIAIKNKISGFAQQQ